MTTRSVKRRMKIAIHSKISADVLLIHSETSTVRLLKFMKDSNFIPHFTMDVTKGSQDTKTKTIFRQSLQ